jgi:hypothetical protein
MPTEVSQRLVGAAPHIVSATAELATEYVHLHDKSKGGLSILPPVVLAILGTA